MADFQTNLAALEAGTLTAATINSSTELKANGEREALQVGLAVQNSRVTKTVKSGVTKLTSATGSAQQWVATSVTGTLRSVSVLTYKNEDPTTNQVLYSADLGSTTLDIAGGGTKLSVDTNAYEALEKVYQVDVPTTASDGDVEVIITYTYED